MISFNSTPVDSPAVLWALQNDFLNEAQIRLGTRRKDKKIFQPSWDVDGPHIYHAATGDGAFAELSDNAKENWRLAIYQLAHETVHLLDQHYGDVTNLLEEGLAVKFSLEMLEKYGFEIGGLPSIESYKKALSLINQLGETSYEIANCCRQSYGDFFSIDLATLKRECPQINDTVLNELLEYPIMR
ncbi:hypothetical protein [Vibrio atlanticus]|uniref:hypothetical protein n=1 Tax=Vibrio atlanticus TaxID=693153 RepID=UPI0022AFFCEE|nr:hypothetical protein [Vibrio atlanticus]MCZ4311612.1 hypothetical protein [Vibrio atlanticus]